MALDVYFIVFFAMGLAPPLRWGLRLLLVLGLMFLFGATLIPAPYDPDPGWGHGLLRAVVIRMYITVIAGIAVRAFFEAGVFGHLRRAGADGPFLAMFDAALLFGLGGWLGCLIFWVLALALQGTDGGLIKHVLVAGVAATLAVVALLLLRNRWSAPIIGAGLTIAALALDGGLRYPDIILTRANGVLQDQPRCMVFGADLTAPTARNDLMALTITKGHHAPSAVMLLVESDNGPSLFRWSFRSRTFVTLPYDTKDRRFCTPSQSTLRVD